MIVHPSSARGFTIIELLVVVSIIALLTSVILTSIGTARTKAQDTSVKQALAVIRNQAALYQSNNSNSYGTTYAVAACPSSGTTMFFADSIIFRAIQQATLAGGGVSRCATDGAAYAVSVQLKSTTDHWCVDSTGAARAISATSWTGVVCP